MVKAFLSIVVAKGQLCPLPAKLQYDELSLVLQEVHVASARPVGPAWTQAIQRAVSNTTQSNNYHARPTLDFILDSI